MLVDFEDAYFSFRNQKCFTELLIKTITDLF